MGMRWCRGKEKEAKDEATEGSTQEVTATALPPVTSNPSFGLLHPSPTHGHHLLSVPTPSSEEPLENLPSNSKRERDSPRLNLPSSRSWGLQGVPGEQRCEASSKVGNVTEARQRLQPALPETAGTKVREDDRAAGGGKVFGKRKGRSGGGWVPGCQVNSILTHPPHQQDQPVSGVGTGRRMEILLSPGGEAVTTALRSGLRRTQG